jgi:succinate dehydrogenase / fumarate reductase cytochrome b subunit
MLWVTVGVWVVVMIPGTYFMLARTAAELFGSK